MSIIEFPSIAALRAALEQIAHGTPATPMAAIALAALSSDHGKDAAR